MKDDLQKVSDNVKKLKDISPVEFEKINSYMEGYLEAKKSIASDKSS